MGEWRLFDEGTIPEYTTAEWYLTRERAPHLEQDQHRGRLELTANLIRREVFFRGRRMTLVDLGAGDGGLLSLLGGSVHGWGYDLAPANVEAAKERRVDVRYGDVLTDPIQWGQIAVATEMLEHLVDPHGFVKAIAEHAEILVCSSPWTERPDNHYEFHTWAWDFDGYRAMVEDAGFVLRKHESTAAFQVILAVAP